MKYLLLIIIFSFPYLLFSQTSISGTVTDPKGETIAGANIYIKDSYDGTSSDMNGKFNFTTSESDSQRLIISCIGYESSEQHLYVKGTALNLKIVLKEIVNELNTVVITAGAFEASDERRITILRPLDIVTTAGAAGDIYGALQTLPGTQHVGDETGLFVRGGDASEAKTFIDGVAVADPYFTGVPDIPQRSRFSPFLFKGTYFSTGGYSAQYGDAMSSALILESQDLPDQTTTNISLMSVGAGIGHTHRWKKTSVGLYVTYINLQPYMSIVKQNYDWTKAPESGNASLIFRQKTSKTGILKAFASYAPSHSIINYTNLNDSLDTTFPYNVHNQNLFMNASYKELIAKHWTLFSSASYSSNLDKIDIGSFDTINNKNTLTQGRVTLSRTLGALSTFRFGGELQHAEFEDHNESAFFNFLQKAHDNYSAGYAEADLYLTPKLVARVGGRLENSSLLKETNIAPRISLAYKTGTNNQVSFAYGQFYQEPDQIFLYATDPLTFERADHFILNFQSVTDKQTFRVEAYYKTYHDLITSVPDTANNGSGYARGVDIFWRDKKTIPFADYWISYSFLDTKRKYLDYPIETVPTFGAKHTLSIVYKQTIPTINVNVGFTYVFASGRPYYNPNNPVFLGDSTPDYHNLSLNASWLTTIFKNFTVIAVSANNVLGFKHVYSYRYSADGAKSVAISDASTRSFFIGVFMSIGEDRGDE